MRAFPLLVLGILLAGCLAEKAPSTSSPRAAPVAWSGATVDAIANVTVATEWLGDGAMGNVEPSLAVSPIDAKTILVAWQVRESSVPSSRASVRVAESTDGGASWRITQPHDPGLSDVPGSVPYQFDERAAFLPDGTAAVLYGGDMQRVGNAIDPASRITLMTSQDGGASWQYHVVAQSSAFAWDFFGFAVAPDTGHLYVATDEIHADSVMLWRSVDAGASWQGPSVLSSGHVHPALAALPGGVVVMETIEGVGRSLVDDPASVTKRPPFTVSVSKDDGRTFGADALVIDGDGAAIDAPSLAADASLRALHAVGVTEQGAVLHAHSDDAGASWAKPSTVSEGSGGPAYWSVIAAGARGEGAVLTRSADARVPWRIDLDAWSGSSAAQRFPLANADRISRAGAMGDNRSDDYGGLAVAADGVVYAAFADPRGAGGSRIAVARIDVFNAS